MLKRKAIREVLAGCLLLALTAGSAHAQSGEWRYHVSFKDKAATTYSPERPEEFLSPKSIERRNRQHLAIDSTDLPVCRAYIDEVERCGVKVLLSGKWENFVTVSCSDTARMERVRLLPFVSEAYKVWTAPSDMSYNTRRDTIINALTYNPDTIYGTAYAQIHISRGDRLHEAGFRGQGMTIAVIDGGFHNLDRIEALNNVRLLGCKSMIPDRADLFAETSHGMSVLSCMAANRPGYMVGTAPEASYWVIRSEDGYSEQPVELDYWAAAVEFADSVGVDLINSSLGYNQFDDPSMNFALHHLDGRASVITRTANRLADKGIVLVCSAGNEGAKSWKKITPPADAFNVLTVGAIDASGELARFSSVGTTADGRLKPDVVAVGVLSDVINAHGSQGHSSGTSFSSPIMCGMVACLWQACPQLTAKELLELVRQSGDRAAHPDNIYGYGVPDLWKAYQTHLGNRPSITGQP